MSVRVDVVRVTDPDCCGDLPEEAGSPGLVFDGVVRGGPHDGSSVVFELDSCSCQMFGSGGFVDAPVSVRRACFCAMEEFAGRRFGLVPSFWRA